MRANQAVEKLRESCFFSGDRVGTTLLPPRVNGNGPHQDIVPERIGDAERRGPNRPAGVLVTVETPNSVSKALAIQVLLKHGASILVNGATAEGMN
jgi:hypothetical protein